MNQKGGGYSGASGPHPTGTLGPHARRGVRDILPLPFPPVRDCPRKLGKRIAQRLCASLRNEERCRETVQALNWMAGCDMNSSIDIPGMNPLQQKVHSRILYLSGICGGHGSLEKISQPEATLKVLLQGRSEYSS